MTDSQLSTILADPAVKPVDKKKAILEWIILPENQKITLHGIVQRIEVTAARVLTLLYFFKGTAARAAVTLNTISLMSGYGIAKLPDEMQESWCKDPRAQEPETFWPIILEEVKRVRQERRDAAKREQFQIFPALHRIPTSPREYRRGLCRMLMDHPLDELAGKINQTPEWIIAKLKERVDAE